MNDRRRVVAAIPLSRQVTERLESLIGGGCRLIDVREADGHERLVLAPPGSPQLLGKLHSAFPDAQLLVVELTDPDYEMRLAGPVTRSLDAGADGYVVARSLEELASRLSDDGPEAAAPPPVSAALPAGSEQDLMALLDQLMGRRMAMAEPPDRAARPDGR